jgi:hypothetical protein
MPIIGSVNSVALENFQYLESYNKCRVNTLGVGEFHNKVSLFLGWVLGSVRIPTNTLRKISEIFKLFNTCNPRVERNYIKIQYQPRYKLETTGNHRSGQLIS